jgi:hypothetical protein
VGINVASNAMKNIIRLVEENVIMRAINMTRLNVINIRCFSALDFETLLILAKSVTTINQHLNTIKGVLSLSVAKIEER